MVTERASPSAQIEGMHAVGLLEDETVGGKSFVRPYRDRFRRMPIRERESESVQERCNQMFWRRPALL
jgi:hypothetical protein